MMMTNSNVKEKRKNSITGIDVVGITIPYDLCGYGDDDKKKKRKDHHRLMSPF